MYKVLLCEDVNVVLCKYIPTMPVLQLDLQSVFYLLFIDSSCNRFVKIKIHKYMGMYTLKMELYESSFFLYNAKAISYMGQCPTKSHS